MGTNRALFHLLWAMLSGALLKSRGAVFSALQVAGFTIAQTRRATLRRTHGLQQEQGDPPGDPPGRPYILTYLAAVLPPLPTGFWGRRPRRPSGRLWRGLAQSGFLEDSPLEGRIRGKSVGHGSFAQGD